MRIRDIDLNHFNIKFNRIQDGLTSGELFITIKPEYLNLYANINLSYTYKTTLNPLKTDSEHNIIVSKLNNHKSQSIKQSMAAKLNKEIKTYRHALSKHPTKELTNKDEFDFSEFDKVDNEQIPMLTDFANKEVVAVSNGKIDDFDDFDFSELYINDKVVTEEVVGTADFDFDEPDVKPETNIETLIKESDFDFDDDVLDTPAPTKTIDDLLLQVRIYRGVLENSTKRTALLLAELKIHETTHEKLKEIVTKLERELLIDLQKKYN